MRIQPPLHCQIFHWKESIKDTPVFRSPTGAAEGVQTSSDRPWKYAHFHSALKILGHATGFKDTISSYVIKRETGNVMMMMMMIFIRRYATDLRPAHAGVLQGLYTRENLLRKKTLYLLAYARGAVPPPGRSLSVACPLLTMWGSIIV